MGVFEAVVLGLVQGITEFLPISSSGHLRVVPAMVGWDDPGAAFTAVIQLGTMAAVLLYFWRDIVGISVTWFRSLYDPALRGTLDARLGWYIGLGTVPIGLAGLAFQDQIETDARDLSLIASTLIVLGLVLLSAERVGRRNREIKEMTLRDSLLVGAAQAMALVPGVSRSGATITAGLFLNLNREAAARYSFLLSIPAVVLSGLFELRDIGEGGVGVLPTLVATLVSFVSGYAAIAWLLRWLSTHSTGVFVAYRVGLGLVIFVLLGAGAIE